MLVPQQLGNKIHFRIHRISAICQKPAADYRKLPLGEISRRAAPGFSQRPSFAYCDPAFLRLR